ncbi:helix-turn-helix domain-containing protein [Streptomyces triculaminicus]|uniref:helix-turn-helix domain-containing protein n=1 Tax=Streptomyces triculaminicus TaxID=2816232 RepID=UPI0033E14A2D
MGSQGEPDPHAARDAAEFVAQLRQLKEAAGLTFRQVEARAAKCGEVLPRSTLADVLRQDSLPRAELLAAFVRVCGQGDHVQEWLAVRERIASQQSASQQQDPSPPRKQGRIGRYGRALGVLLVLLALVGGGAYLTVGRTSGGHGNGTAEGATASSGPPALAPGTYRIRSAVSSLCLSERDGEGTGNVYQADCRSSIPTYALEEADGGAYRIRSLHPVFGYGCLGVGNGSSKRGAQMMDDYCGHRGVAESFRLRREGTPAGGYRVMPLHTGACLSVPGGSKQQWAPVLQLPCAATDAGQVFHFDPVASPRPIPTVSSN